MVDDGSRDNTRKIVEQIEGVNLISSEKNRGKSHAVMQGLKAANGNFIMLLDADLEGLRQEDLKALIDPVLNKEAEVSISLGRNAPFLWRWIGLDFISGERVFHKNLLDPNILENKKGFELEATMNKIIIRNNHKVKVVRWNTVIRPWKSEKIGNRLAGLKADVKMVRHVLKGAGGLTRSCVQIFKMLRCSR